MGFIPPAAGFTAILREAEADVGWGFLIPRSRDEETPSVESEKKPRKVFFIVRCDRGVMDVPRDPFYWIKDTLPGGST